MDDDFHDSQDSQENLSPQTLRGNSDNNMDTSGSIDPMDPQDREETNRALKTLYGDIEPPLKENQEVTRTKSMENIQNPNIYDNFSSYRSEYTTDVEQQLKLKIKRVEMPANVVRRTLDFHNTDNTSEEERGAQSLLLQKSLKAAVEANNRLPTPPPQTQPNHTQITPQYPKLSSSSLHQ